MLLKVHLIDIAGRGILVHKKDAVKAGVIPGDRIEVKNQVSGKTFGAPVETTSSLVQEGTIGILKENAEHILIKEGDSVDVSLIPMPSSLEYIKKKMDGKKLSREEMQSIITDISNDNLSSGEISAFVASIYINRLDMDEIESMTRAMVETGDKLEFFSGPVVDKHSIGGVPGNKVTLLIVPIVAANGLLIPKTSSRAITGAAGTADIMEVLAPVEFSAEELTRMTQKNKGVIVWGGSTNLVPADDKIIHQEYPLKINPVDKMLASVMAKKFAAGVSVLAIDMPVGKFCKVKNKDEGEALAQKFIELGKRLGIRVECALTYGDAPVGRSIGPKLEVKEALSVLEGADNPKSFIDKSCALAGIVLELAGKANPGEGYNLAYNTIKTGAALKKMKEIIEIQGGDPSVSSSNIIPGEFSQTIHADVDGFVVDVNNRSLISVARTAGSPSDHGAGIYLHAKSGLHLNKGDPVFTIYADHKWKLDKAVEEARVLNPIVIEGMLIERYPHQKIWDGW